MVEFDVGAHTFQFRAMHEALWEDAVFDDADAGGGDEQGGHLRLHVGRVTGERGGVEIDALWRVAALDVAGVAGFVEVDAMAGFEQGGGDGFEVVAVDAFEGDTFACEGGGGHEGAGFNAIRDDGVDDAFEFLDAFDDDTACACAGDFGTHGVEEIGEVEDFWFGGGGFDDGDAFGECCGHHDVVCAENGGAAFAAEVDFRAAEAVGCGEDDVTAFEFDFCAEGGHAF